MDEKNKAKNTSKFLFVLFIFIFFSFILYNIMSGSEEHNNQPVVVEEVAVAKDVAIATPVPVEQAVNEYSLELEIKNNYNYLTAEAADNPNAELVATNPPFVLPLINIPKAIDSAIYFDNPCYAINWQANLDVSLGELGKSGQVFPVYKEADKPYYSVFGNSGDTYRVTKEKIPLSEDDIMWGVHNLDMSSNTFYSDKSDLIIDYPFSAPNVIIAVEENNNNLAIYYGDQPQIYDQIFDLLNHNYIISSFYVDHSIAVYNLSSVEVLADNRFIVHRDKDIVITRAFREDYLFVEFSDNIRLPKVSIDEEVININEELGEDKLMDNNFHASNVITIITIFFSVVWVLAIVLAIKKLTKKGNGTSSQRYIKVKKVTNINDDLDSQHYNQANNLGAQPVAPHEFKQHPYDSQYAYDDYYQAEEQRRAKNSSQMNIGNKNGPFWIDED